MVTTGESGAPRNVNAHNRATSYKNARQSTASDDVRKRFDAKLRQVETTLRALEKKARNDRIRHSKTFAEGVKVLDGLLGYASGLCRTLPRGEFRASRERKLSRLWARARNLINGQPAKLANPRPTTGFPSGAIAPADIRVAHDPTPPASPDYYDNPITSK